MQELYRNIIQRLDDARPQFLERGLPPVETVDLYDGQPEDPEAYEFTCPALFLDYKIDWERGASGVKRGTVAVDLHILLNPMPGTENWSDLLPAGLQKMEYYDLVAQILEGVDSTNVGELYITGEEPRQTDYFCYHLFHMNAPIIHRHNTLKPAPLPVVPEITPIVATPKPRRYAIPANRTK